MTKVLACIFAFVASGLLADTTSPVEVTTQSLSIDKAGRAVIQVTLLNVSKKTIVAVEYGIRLLDVFGDQVVDQNTEEPNFVFQLEKEVKPNSPIQITLAQSDLKGTSRRPRTIDSVTVLRVAFQDGIVWKIENQDSPLDTIRRDIAFVDVGPFTVLSGDEVPTLHVIKLSIGYLRLNEKVKAEILSKQYNIQQMVIEAVQKYAAYSPSDANGSFYETERDWLSRLNYDILKEGRAAQLRIRQWEEIGK